VPQPAVQVQGEEPDGAEAVPGAAEEQAAGQRGEGGGADGAAQRAQGREGASENAHRTVPDCDRT